MYIIYKEKYRIYIYSYTYKHCIGTYVYGWQKEYKIEIGMKNIWIKRHRKLYRIKENLVKKNIDES